MPLPNIADLKNGDPTAWEEAWRYLWPTAHGAVHQLLHAQFPEEIDDVAIESIEAMISMLDKIRSTAEMRPLLASIAYRRACSRKRYLRAKCRDKNQNFNLDTAKNIPEETNSALGQLDQKELAALLTNLGNELNPQTRVVLEDFFFNRLNYNELAKKHQIPLGTVGTRIHRGLSGIREILEKNPKLMEEIEAFLR